MKKIIYLFILSMTIISCQKDDFIETPEAVPDIVNTTQDDNAFLENFGTTISSGFIGKIVNVNGIKLKDVQITIGGQTTMTDHNGVFVLNNVSVYKKFAYVTVTKQGYINGSRALVPTPNGSNDIQITLLEKNIVGTVSSGSESEVTMTNGSIVRFQGDFIDASGNPYSGQVEVSMHYLEPNQEATFTQMPGMLLAQDASNNAKVLETYGMLGVNLYSPSGEQLNISETSPASLEFPVSTSTPNAPETIALWYFDEVVGYWKEQGVATKIGNKYIAEVTHFSWWNCDLANDLVTVCFNLRTHAQLANYYVEIIRNENSQMIFSGYTNIEGEECGLFPANEEVTIKVYSECLSSVLYEEVIGVGSTDTSIEIIVPPISDIMETTIMATLNDCSGNPITNGYVLLFDDANQNGLNDYILVPITNGQLDYNLSHCNVLNYSMMIFDELSNTSTDIISLVLVEGVLGLGTISTCTTTGGIYNGDVNLGTQQEIDNFGLFGYTEITGDLTITDNQTDDITSLLNLGELVIIGGKLSILSTSSLVSLQGLERITTVERLKVQYNPSLLTMQGLNGLEVINGLTYQDGLFIQSNSSLISLEGLENLTTITKHLVVGSNSLNSLIGLNNLSQIGGDIGISYDNTLTSLHGLESINSIQGKLFVSNNGSLSNLNGLNNLNSISGDLQIYNNSLTSLVGLDGLTLVGGILTIDSNSLLISLQGLDNISTIEGSLSIWNNTSLNSLTNLGNLTTVSGSIGILKNNSLTSLEGLDNIVDVGFEIGIGTDQWNYDGGNLVLADFCALTNLLNNGTYGTTLISNNSYNPTVQDIINGNCAQ